MTAPVEPYPSNLIRHANPFTQKITRITSIPTAPPPPHYFPHFSTVAFPNSVALDLLANLLHPVDNLLDACAQLWGNPPD